MAVAPGRGSGATGKGALKAKGRRSPPEATSSRPVSCLPPPARPGSLRLWAPASPRPPLGRSLSFLAALTPHPTPPFREMSSLEGGFSPSSAPLGAGTVLGRTGKHASRAGRTRVAPPAPEGDPLPGAGAGAGEGARARDARRHRSAKGPLEAAVLHGAKCLRARDTLSGLFLPLRPWISDGSLSARDSRVCLS